MLVLVFIPSRGAFLLIDEGTGDDLLPEDINDGYRDYLNYEIYDQDPRMGDALPIDEGGVLFEEYIAETFMDARDMAKHVVKEAYGENLEFEILECDGDTLCH